MNSIYSYSLEELTKIMLAMGQSAYRSKQIFSWLYKKRVKSFDEMNDISLSFREELKKNFDFFLPTIDVMEKSKDGTIKCLFKLRDGERVEGVLMHYVYGYSVCVSSQVGCNMSCAFCASGLLKKKRNLTPDEMLGQVLAFDEILRKDGNHVTHCVVMGTGEPFDNYDNVLSFIRILNSPFALDIGARHITVSTCGVVPSILRFGKEGLQVNLAISLHAPTNELRDKLMPINKAYPLEKLIPAIIQYGNDSNGRRVTFEYILIKGVNDSIEDAKKLERLIRPTFGYVNLIPYNPVVENGYERADDESVTLFHNYLLSKKVKSTIRKEFGSDIDAACGQLRAKYER
ncbi:MAG: 23S rRNA (adenine(2503)-C(2))-methyltransferase RlmN [Candidatus Enterosoma sp.]|nr:23S rRNA (adenine(2503)-C(2))-methyltransferase RlmN [bacterium]MDY3080824.1 23S rRNA (adenine(2503)-C(2))-methyltransferase RlmN [Candidatus Enterosoma sp.]MDD7617287.1 23S rRNA (adenine(2503)-C(2))-methyltransferase RlmN [bacterium]MDY5909279.1 23S rRNA (adenine(2503)-C(2))-methyltransferase RlmN [Candidatus Enterosoma sp.]MDY5970317.1 23S rRNA (adenine(2503)-C(2))-methyltransferase RlmN [Candidatus Enterosoma sp.]